MSVRKNRWEKSLKNCTQVQVFNYTTNYFYPEVEITIFGKIFSYILYSVGIWYFELQLLRILFTLWRASFFLGLIWPRANASFFIVHQAGWTRDRIKFSVHTIVELIADFWIFVCEITVLSRAMFSWLRRFYTLRK